MRSAIIIPHFQQSGYLVEAVASATANNALVVVVDDCSSPSWMNEVRSLSRLRSGANLVLLQHPTNRGLSAARNTGIRWLLENFPSVEFILPLDADDLIESTTIARLEDAFDASMDSDTGWLCGDATLFGTFEGMARMPARINRYRLSQENICFATSFLRREVFERGVWYDETLRSGFEDWDFFLRAAEAGWRALHVGDFGFHYRKHGLSMLAESRNGFSRTKRTIRQNHPETFGPGCELALEHQDMPRFAVVNLDDGVTTLLSSPDLPGRQLGAESLALEEYLPPIVVAARADWLSQVSVERTWHQVLALTQVSLRTVPYLALGWHQAPRVDTRGLLYATVPDQAAGFVFSTSIGRHYGGLLAKTLADGRTPTNLPQLGPMVGTLPPQPGPIHPGAIAAIDTICTPAPLPPRRSSHDEIAPNDRTFAEVHSIQAQGRTELRSRHKDAVQIGVIVPWIGLGGMDMIMLEFARCLSTRPGNKIHLMTTAAGLVEANSTYLEAFTTINPLPDVHDAEVTVKNFMAEMDVLLIANSAPALKHLGTLDRETRPTTIVFIQNVDIASDGQAVGFLYPMARQFERLIDGFVVPSNLTSDLLANFGVPRHKRVVVPNAAIYQPDHAAPSHQSAINGWPSAGRPMRLLFAGRFDRQKGLDRLVSIVEELKTRNIDFELRMVGKELLEGEPLPSGDTVMIVPPTFDAAAMAEHFSWADCLVLPSRWEGLPLVMLDAMAFSVLVLTTDVGGIAEYVKDERECVLVEDLLGDRHVINRFADALSEFSRNPEAFDGIRASGSAFSASLRWDELTDEIETLFDRTEGK